MDVWWFSNAPKGQRISEPDGSAVVIVGQSNLSLDTILSTKITRDESIVVGAKVARIEQNLTCLTGSPPPKK